MPVQHYSSGMKVRLGFAVAAQMQPDVLIIDEVLAVGDLGFMLKCFKTIDTILPNTAIIFVSHSMPQVSRLCNQIILMDRGEPQYHGKNVAKAIDFYYTRFANNESNIVFTDGSLELDKAELLEPHSYIDEIPQLQWKSPLKLYFRFNLKKPIKHPVFKISVFDKEQRPVALLRQNTGSEDLTSASNSVEFMVTHNNLQLSKGVYTINISVSGDKTLEPLLSIYGVLSFQVNFEEEIWPPFLLDAEYKKVYNSK